MIRTVIYFAGYLLFPAFGFAQHPLAAFKNDPGISDHNGRCADSSFHYLLYKMQEPVLSNYYLGKTIYRFTLECDIIGTAFMIRVEKDSNGLSVITKELVLDHEQQQQGYGAANGNRYSLYTLAGNEQKQLDEAAYAALTHLVDTFFTHPVAERNRPGNDGADWTLEISTADGYYIKSKWSPDKNDPFRKVGEQMISLSTLSHKKWLKKM